MNIPDDADRLPGGQRRCTARRTDGSRCKSPAITGATVCRVHGGSAPQVRRAARLRLLDLVDPAISTMAKIMNDPETKEADRLRAAENILDRAGYPRQLQVDSDSARDLLMVRLLELRAQALAERDQVVDEAREIVEGDVIVDENSPQEAAGDDLRAEQVQPIHPDHPEASEADETGDDRD